MNDQDPFSPPFAPLDPSQPNGHAVKPDFYVVSPFKLVLLNMATFNFFMVFWFYHQWRAVKRQHGLSVWPVPRALFCVFFTNALFRYFKAAETAAVEAKAEPSAKPFPFESFATGLLGIMILIVITNRWNPEEPGAALMSLVITLVLVPAATAVLYPIQKAVNKLCLDPSGASNNRFSWVQWVFLILGLGLWLMALLVIVVPTPPV